MQQGHQLKRLGRGYQFTPFAQHIFFVDQAFNNGGARRWCTQPFGAHGFAQFVVFNTFPCAFHGTQQGRFGITRWRFGHQFHCLKLVGQRLFSGGHRHQRGVFFLRGLAINFEPTRFHQHLAFGLEVMPHDFGDTRRHQIFGCRKKYRQKTPGHQIINFLLYIVQVFRRFLGRNNGKVVADFAVIKNALIRLDPAPIQNFCGMGVIIILLAQTVERGFDGLDIVFGQMARVGTRVGQYLEFFVQFLRNTERGFGREAEFGIGLALQGS